MSTTRSLRTRLIVAMIVTTAVVMAVAASIAWLASERMRMQAFDAALRDRAQRLRPQLEEQAWRWMQDSKAGFGHIAREPGIEERFALVTNGFVVDPADGPGSGVLVKWYRALPRDGSWSPDGELHDGIMADIGAVRWLELPVIAHPPPGEGPPPRPRDPPPFRADGQREEDAPPWPGHEHPPADGRGPADDQRPGPPRDGDRRRPFDPSSGVRPPSDHPHDRGGPIHIGNMVLAGATRGMRAELTNQAWLLAGMGTLACALAAAVVALVISRLLRPLRRLGDDIHGVVPGERATLAVAALPSELLPVQARLNELLVRVAEVLERERTTTANIAHELRTPLAGLRAKLELALLREREPEQIATLCRQGLATMTHLQGLVDNLLLLARLESGLAAPLLEAVEVAEALAVAWSLHQPAAEARGLRLERAIEPALALTTDAGKLRAILGNLLSNAVSYADPGSAIRVAAREEGSRVRIEVVNVGATIAPNDAERVFEPFWRGDAARTVESGHCGLGLPLVRRLATILGGTITVAVDGREFRAALLLPEAPPRR